TNLKDALNIKDINPKLSQSDSIIEMEEMFGIEAARMKIIMEIYKLIPDIAISHAMLLADEMTSLGIVTNNDNTGLNVRNKDSVLLCAAAHNPMRAITKAALDGV